MTLTGAYRSRPATVLAQLSSHFPLLAVALLAVFLAVSYTHVLALAFVNDDYIFLDKVRHARLTALWSCNQPIFGWYRPWSREFHYWALLHMVGLREPGFHLVSFGLWLTALGLYLSLLQRLAGRVAATIATAGVAALGLWGGPLLWVAGAQDLWMLVFALLFLHAIARDRTLLATATLILALLSKESAAVLPLLATAYHLLVTRLSTAQYVRRTALYWAIFATWVWFHPTLLTRLIAHPDVSEEVAQRPGLGGIVAKTLLSQLNLEAPLAPTIGWPKAVAIGGLGAVVLCSLILVALRTRPIAVPRPDGASGIHGVLAFGAAWALSGWSILVMPSISWHAYYGVFGALGFWMCAGVLLSYHWRSALLLVAALCVFRGARASTPSWDWGTDWYQTRAGTILSSIRTNLLARHPTFPPHSRLYFANVPYYVGLLAGDGPAFRVWYDDPSLKAHFYSAYALRTTAEPTGADYFFRVDSIRTLVEVTAGAEPLSGHTLRNPAWRRDHLALATLFLHAGNVGGAAQQYMKLHRVFPERAEYALYAGAALEASGDARTARAYYADASLSLGAREVSRAAAALVREARSYADSVSRALARPHPAAETRSPPPLP